mmetsp:Transcript_105401/g.293446  ORF Transcript_105401/g.293446 Transcript_105401/m.293446 type:complete len:436 (+) Transcript_105401:352-1659(+)
MLPGNAELDLPVVLDVLQLGAGLADDVLVAPGVDLHLLVDLAGVRELRVAVGGDVVDDALGLLHVRRRAGEADLELLRRRRARRHCGDVHLDAELVLDLADDDAALADEVGEVAGVHGHEVLGEVLVLHGAIALLHELPHRLLRLGDRCRGARDGEDLAGGVDLRPGLLLDHLDLRALGADDDADLLLRHLHLGRGGAPRRRCLDLGPLLVEDRGHLGGGEGLRHLGAPLRHAHRRHARDVLLGHARRVAHGLGGGRLLLGALLPLLQLLRDARVELPGPAGAIVERVVDELLLALLLRLLLLDGLRRGLRLRLALRLRLCLRLRLRLCTAGGLGLAARRLQMANLAANRAFLVNKLAIFLDMARLTATLAHLGGASRPLVARRSGIMLANGLEVANLSADAALLVDELALLLLMARLTAATASVCRCCRHLVGP